MKPSTTALVLSIASLAIEAKAGTPTTKCNADNCARAVTGTFRGQATLAAHLADCSSFQWATFTPETFTVTETAVSNPGQRGRRSQFGRRQNDRGGNRGRGGSCFHPTRVPSYASACSGTVRYASACSCAGITQSTVTLETPTVTVTVPPEQATETP